MQKLSTYLRRLFQACILAVSASAVAACAFDPAEGEGGAPSAAEENVGTVTQALQGCGVEVWNSWAEPLSGGMWHETWFKNLGSSPCAIRWTFENKKNNVVTESQVYPSASTWLTVQPGATVKRVHWFPGITSPCSFRTHLKMGSTWYTDFYAPCF